MPEKQHQTETQTNEITGLTSEEAAERLKKYGSNAIEIKETSWISRLLKRFWGQYPG